MDHVLGRLKLRKRERRESDARRNIQDNLYGYSRFSGLGFPSKPSALAHDSHLDILAVGTKSGALKIYGRPGVCFHGQHSGDVAIINIVFLSRQGQLITLCSDNSLHLWEFCRSECQNSTLEEKKSFNVEQNRLKTVSSCCLVAHKDLFLLGTEVGNVHFFNTKSFSLSDVTISSDLIAPSSNEVSVEGEEVKSGPGAAECICQHPQDRNKVLIGFTYGLIVLWNIEEHVPVKIYNSMQTLEHVTFVRGGEEFVSCHSDGSYIVWSTADAVLPKEPATAPYGPFPCCSMRKILWKTTNAEPFIVFSGGMPRASYGDRYTITVMHGESHVVFDFTSRVVDFLVLCNSDQTDDGENRDDVGIDALIVLAEEELIVIDMATGNWPLFRLPYLVSIHCSAVTSISYTCNVPEELWNKIVATGSEQFAQYSSRDWPISGGKMLGQECRTRDLLLTGHEDGSVNFWDVSMDGAIRLLYKLNTASIFGINTALHVDGSGDSEDYGEWPPFRKVGIYDPFTDDPRLAIQKIHLCVLSEMLIVAGMAGQVIVFQYERDEREQDVRIATINVVSDLEDFSWRGHSALEVKNCPSRWKPGFQPICVLQMMPPVPCTALAFQPEWQLVCIGTAYGLGLFDYVRCKTVYTKCTVTSSGESNEGVILSRRKSLQRLLRRSLRRLQRRSIPIQRVSVDSSRDKEFRSSGQANMTEQGDVRQLTLRDSLKKDNMSSASKLSDATSHLTSESGSQSLQTVTSIVRCLHFAQVFLLNTQTLSPTLWVGTNNGSIYIFQLTITANDRRTQDAVQCTLAKEIRLRHGAPVVSIQVLDRAGQPLAGPLEVQHERAKAPDMTGQHFVVICSQQQLKAFTLPNLKPYHKFKFAMQKQGVQLSRLVYTSFRSKTDETYVEMDAVGLTADGDVSVFTIPQIRPQFCRSVIRKDNASGIGNCVFTPNGMGYFLCSPSELERFSLSARFPATIACNTESSKTRDLDLSANQSTVSEETAAGPHNASDARDADDVRSDVQLPDEANLAEDDQHTANFIGADRMNESRSLSLHPASGASDVAETSRENHLTSGLVHSSFAASDNGLSTAVNGNADVQNDSENSSLAQGVELVTCTSVITIPFSTKVVKADVHAPPPGKGFSHLCEADLHMGKEFDEKLSSATEFEKKTCLTAEFVAGVR